ncbi:hypothetical protein J6590_072294 [Homalodisca vitripennis]|nr:hypothetical protein J6590_072294 [Homalodisca vitripennis]
MATLETGVHEALACFNLGNLARCKSLAKLGIIAGVNCLSALKKLDETRIAKAEKADSDIEKKCRQSAVLARRRLEDEHENEEDQTIHPMEKECTKLGFKELIVVYFGRSWDKAPETGSGTNRVRPNLGQKIVRERLRV